MLTAKIQCLKINKLKNIRDRIERMSDENEGDIVFDPCCGSGAHCLVAKEENRNYIGVELKNQYYEIAKERLQ